MTLRQQAYSLIDSLPDDSVRSVIRVMRTMLPGDGRKTGTKNASSDVDSSKMKAYLRMQELRKETAKYSVSAAERAAALGEKFGTLGIEEI